MNNKDGYNNLPIEWMPWPNFEYRPASEISENSPMDVISIISSSSSSSSWSDAEDVSTSISRSTFVSPSTSQTPSIKVISPYEEPQRARMRSVDEDIKILDRPRLRKKSATAPPGGIRVQGYAPQPPRRATSAGKGELKTIQRRNSQQESYVMDLMSVGKCFDQDQLGRQQQMSQQGRLPSRQPRKVEQRVNGRLKNRAQLSGSFSQKARVKKTLDAKSLGQLSIVDLNTPGLLSSPRSIMNTPAELYATPEKRSIDRVPPPLSKQDPSSPDSIEARKFIMSSLSPQSPHLQQNLSVQSRKKSGKKVHQDVRQQIHVPGPIRLEKHPGSQGRESVSTLDPLDDVIGLRSIRNSDMIILNSLTLFFADSNVVEDATEQCLDRLWHDTEPEQHHNASYKKPSITSIEEMHVPEIPGKPENRCNPRDSRFSFSSASSNSSMLPPGTRMRQRDKLRRLLSPAFVGSAKSTPGD